ncbi:BURP domain-containing protein 6-like [Silene latifolia]|uniref:BURP domain-containing protein 6-like n=1 Tax=Silene latifolia TaxID=37657 RepID=UPI003D773EEC
MDSSSSIHFGFLITLLVFSVGQAAPFDAKLYWESQLPNIPMPQTLLDVLPMEFDGNNVGDRLRTVADTKDMLRAYGVEDDHGQADIHTNHNDDFISSRFFLAKDLRVGAKLSVGFETQGNFTRFPPHSLTQTMPPFNSDNLNNILRFYSIKPGSTEAKVIGFNLRLCDRNDHINGLCQYCATTLEQLVSYLSTTFGSSDIIKAAALPPNAFKRDRLMTYKVLEINTLATAKDMVACHRAGFPYALFRCHKPESTAAYQITLAGVHDGAIVKAYGVCHTDTNGWNPNFIGLRTLSVKPGTHICHFLHFHDVIWYRPSQGIQGSSLEQTT